MVRNDFSNQNVLGYQLHEGNSYYHSKHNRYGIPNVVSSFSYNPPESTCLNANTKSILDKSIPFLASFSDFVNMSKLKKKLWHEILAFTTEKFKFAVLFTSSAHSSFYWFGVQVVKTELKRWILQTRNARILLQLKVYINACSIQCFLFFSSTLRAVLFRINSEHGYISLRNTDIICCL